ncbi:MAG: prevent-host-death protein [Gammaproteobacteria bacterium HGW-Gammaproteobacteria-6]|nr:MAG: prevent-host-death protein [Gammaproteobacteria bacterium HGW-Gammaproteobacteria-6]
MEIILSDASISVSELKRNPSAVIAAAEGAPVAVLVHNKPSAYLVPAATFQRMLERLEDMELAELVRSRAKERRVKVALDAL